MHLLLVLSSAFSALTLLVGRQEGYPACKKTEWWGACMVICLERGAGLHMVQLMPLPLIVSCFSKIQIGLPFWYRLSRVVPDKRQWLCVCVFSALTLLVGRQEGHPACKKTEWWGAGVVICLERSAD